MFASMVVSIIMFSVDLFFIRIIIFQYRVMFGYHPDPADELQCALIFLRRVIFQISGDLPIITLPFYDDDVTPIFRGGHFLSCSTRPIFS